jgi:hypothetical protein
MKLKLNSKKITVRLSVKELEQIQAKHLLCERIFFPDGSDLCYQLNLNDELEFGINGNYIAGLITLEISREALKQLHTPSKQGVINSYHSNGEDFTIAVEVDIKEQRKMRSNVRSF